MKIAVDFDGTIVEHRFPEIGMPKPFAFEVLNALKEEGNDLILWSNREGKRLEEAVNFCKEKGLEFYAVNSEFPEASWSGSGVSRKLVADVYIDDKNLGGLPDWGEIYTILSKKAEKDRIASDYFHQSGRRHSSGHHRKWRKYVPEFIWSFIDRCRTARATFKI